jgi:hypothetical protein
MRFLLVLIITLLFTGCASTEKYVADNGLSETNSSTVYIYRTDLAYRSLDPEKPFFFLDGKLVGKLGTGEFVRFLVSSGNHSVSSKESFLFTPSSESGNVKGEFESGKTYYFRYSKDFARMSGTGAGFVMSDTSSLKPATNQNFVDKS